MQQAAISELGPLPPTTSCAALTRGDGAAIYLLAGQIQLMDNALQWEPLQPEHVRPRLLGPRRIIRG